jgi:PAS domain S-box-containing protein
MDKKALSILLVEDNPADAELIVRELCRSGFVPEWKRVQTEPDFRASLNAKIDIILSDYSMPQFDGMCALELLKKQHLDIPFIIVSGTIGEDIAVEAMQKGAADYLLKDRLARLNQAVEHALAEKKLREEQKQAEARLQFQEQQYRLLFEINPNPMWVFDTKTMSILAVNQAAIAQYGYTREEFLQLSIKDLRPAEDVPDLIKARAISSQKERRLGYRGRNLFESCELGQRRSADRYRHRHHRTQKGGGAFARTGRHHRPRPRCGHY